MVVVGGGPCALAAVRELADAGVAVTVLDAGRRAPRGITVRVAGRTVLRWVQPGFRSDDRQRSSRDPATRWISSLSWGGLTNYWTGACPRFHPNDFTDGAAISDIYEWPLRYDELVPFYERCEDHLRLTAGDGFATAPPGRARYYHDPASDWAEVIAAARAAGHPIGPIPISKGRSWMAVARPREFVAEQCLDPRSLRSGLVRVRRGCRVLRVRPDGARWRVEHLGPDGSLEETTVRAVVLAAGALDTTEILLRSGGADFPGGLGNAHGVLGRYLHDHPREWWPVDLDRPLTALSHPMYVAREAYGAGPPLHASSLTIGLARGRDRLPTLWNGRRARVGVQVLGTMTPSERAGIFLDGDPVSNAPESLLAIDLVFDEATRGLMDEARQRFVRVMADAGVGATLGPGHTLVPGEAAHFGGTARMHADPRHGVVDAWNRVHGAAGIVVADASCFTTTPEKNPTLTAMALAARAARRLAAELGDG